ncbi:MAG: stage III sporulation protein AD [Lachnospiraceae bacterium]|nr:stage III sporulation protein AD [Lachnospiraceae bacterium]
MSIVKICILAVAGVLLASHIKSQKSEYAVFLSLGICVLVLIFSVDRLSYIVEMISGLLELITIDRTYLVLLLKLIGIAYITEFAAALCKEAGFGAIAGQVELAGKLTMVFMSIPVAFSVLEVIREFLGT